MFKLLKAFRDDENGFIVSAELVLIASIAVLSMIVGLVAVSHSINNELKDVAEGFAHINQSNDDYGDDEYSNDYTAVEPDYE